MFNILYLCRCLLQGNELKKYICHLCSSKFQKGSGLTKHLRLKHYYALPAGHKRFRFVCCFVLCFLLVCDAFCALTPVADQHIGTSMFKITVQQYLRKLKELSLSCSKYRKLNINCSCLYLAMCLAESTAFNCCYKFELRMAYI